MTSTRSLILLLCACLSQQGVAFSATQLGFFGTQQSPHAATRSRTVLFAADHGGMTRSSRAPKQRELRDSNRAIASTDPWLSQTTQQLLESEPGSLKNGKWHELVSMMTAWSKRVNKDVSAHVVLESLLKRLIDERRAGNDDAKASAFEYNMVISAWTEVAQHNSKEGKQASERALYILRLLQRAHDEEQRSELLPTSFSFTKVLAALSHAKDSRKAKTTLRWMEALYERGLNRNAKPQESAYTYVLNSIADSGEPDAGKEAEQLLRHMNDTGTEPKTMHYTVAIKSWMRQESRQGAEQAEQLFKSMNVHPDIFTYGSLLNAWAVSGMREYGAERADAIMQKLREDPKVSPNQYAFNVNMNAWSRSSTIKAIDRTEALLEEMYSRNLTVDWFTYNIYLQTLSAHGSVPGIAQKADGVLRMMLKRAEEGEEHLRPNRFSYNTVIDAWSRCTNYAAPMQAFKVLQLLLQDKKARPDAFSFNQVLNCFARSQLRGAAVTAEKLLADWHKAYDTGLTSAKPSCIAYTSVISAWGRSGETGAAERAEKILFYMEHRASSGDKHLSPNTIAYNTVIDAWARSGEGTLGARKAEALLRRMQEQFEAGNYRVEPNSITWNGVLNAWAKSGTRCCAHQAQKYLDQMWEVYKSGNTRVCPDDKTYNTVISAISNSQNVGKAQLALRVLRKMDKLHKKGALRDSPDGITYTTVLQSCAVSSNFDERSRLKALDTAIFTLEEIIDRPDVKPNHVTYEVFLKAVVNLMPEAYKLKKEVVEPVFRNCTKDGFVTLAFLTYLRDAVPEDLYKELLGGVAVEIEQDLPKAWTKNVPRRGRRSRSSGMIATQRNR
jgi:hypothetical protein